MVDTRTHFKVCVLVATYNGERWIDKQIETILNQKHVFIQIFINDDFSTDSTLAKCFKHQKKNNNISIIKQPLRLGSASQNFFWLISNVDLNCFDFVALADQDDEWFGDKLKNAIDKLLLEKSDAYSSNVIAIWPDGKRKIIDKAQKQKKYDYIFESAGPGCTFVISKKLAIELQILLKSNKIQLRNIDLHDWFIYAFARSKGYKWSIDPVPNMYYRQHSNNVVGANVGLMAFFKRIEKLKSGWLKHQSMEIAKYLGYENEDTLNKLSNLNLENRIYLALHVCDYRRRFRDQIVLAFYFLFIA